MMKHPEEWLKEHCLDNDYNRLEENLKDSLWTSNVIRYMEEYVDYILQQTPEAQG